MRYALLSLALSLEAVALWVVLHGDLLAAPLFGLLHTAASIVAAGVLPQLLPPHLHHSKKQASLLFAAFALFLPLAGLLGATVGVLLSRHLRTVPAIGLGWATVPIPDLPFRPVRISPHSIYSEAHFFDLLRYAKNGHQRLRAVMATRQMADQYAIPLLTMALKDPSDDVRLLAYAILDRKEQEIHASIRDRLRELEGSDQTRRAVIHKRIALDYWEFAYLGLAQGDLLAHVLGAALEHDEKALAETPQDAALHQLRGRILLRQEKLDEAEAALVKARNAGLPEQAILPLLAEIAFRKRRFDAVRTHLEALDPVARSRAPLSRLVAYWL